MILVFTVFVPLKIILISLEREDQRGLSLSVTLVNEEPSLCSVTRSRLGLEALVPLGARVPAGTGALKNNRA